jgi:NAD(P)-dependent dehydrogenase (short-subunit alcohol dehydrogenase family)
MTNSEPIDTSFRVLVIGTTPGSFGDMVCRAFAETFEGDRYLYPNWSVVRAGIGNLGPGKCIDYDVRLADEEHDRVMAQVRPHHVVYAVGKNYGDAVPAPTGLAASAQDHLELNLVGFLRVAEAFRKVAMPGSHLVAVSSNSARIPRSPSVGYCVSKAALSMAVRVLARRWAGEPIVWGIEPGLMNTQATIDMVGRGGWGTPGMQGAHRMIGVSSRYGLPGVQLAENLTHNVLWGGHWLNGTLQQMDAGEL